MNELELKIFDLICQANDKSSEGKHFTVYGVIAVLDDMSKKLERLALREHAEDFICKYRHT